MLLSRAVEPLVRPVVTAYHVAAGSLDAEASDRAVDHVAARLGRAMAAAFRPAPPLWLAELVEDVDMARSASAHDEALRLAIRGKVLLPLRAARMAAAVGFAGT